MGIYLDKASAGEKLREIVKPGDTVHTVLRNVSASGMTRVISLLVIKPAGEVEYGIPRNGVTIVQIDSWAALAIDAKMDQDREGIKVSGGGMDMGFHLVYRLGRALWPTGEAAATGYVTHRNGSKDPETDGGYLLAHAWL